MVLYQLDLARFLTVYIGQGLIFAFYLFIAFKILKRDRRRLHIILSLYYIFTAIGLFLSFIYTALTDQNIVKLLNTASDYIIGFALIFLMLFNLILFMSKREIKNYFLVTIILIYAILLLFMFLDPTNVKIDPSTNWKPVWSFNFLFYLLIVVSFVYAIPTLYFSIAIYKRFKDPQLKKKWKSFIYGMIGMDIILYGTMISNTLNDPTFRLIMGIFAISILLWGYLLYYGVGKQIDK